MLRVDNRSGNEVLSQIDRHSVDQSRWPTGRLRWGAPGAPAAPRLDGLPALANLLSTLFKLHASEAQPAGVLHRMDRTLLPRRNLRSPTAPNPSWPTVVATAHGALSRVPTWRSGSLPRSARRRLGQGLNNAIGILDRQPPKRISLGKPWVTQIGHSSLSDVVDARPL